VLALATLAAIVFAWLNFLQRSRYDLGMMVWRGPTARRVEAWKVAADSPAPRWNTFWRHLLAINDVAVPRAAVVANRLYRPGFDQLATSSPAMRGI